MTPDIVEALKFQVQRVRDLEERSRPGVEMLHPSSRDCIEAARVLYCGIVDEVERNDFDVFGRRATVPMRRRLAVAGPALWRARRARREFGSGQPPTRKESHVPHAEPGGAGLDGHPR
jgi:phytoene synthase